MASSPARTAANRLNALKSTGPRTETGKSRASLNALRHGLTSQVVVLPGEDMDAYRSFGQGFFTDLRPSGALEEQLVQTLIDTQWRLNRFRAHEANLFALGHEEHASEIQTEDESIQTALACARTLRENTDALKTLSIHEQRLNRLFQTTLKQFLEIRAGRLHREGVELEESVLIRKHHKRMGRPFDPADFGFVLTNEQMDLRTRRRNAHSAAVLDRDQRRDAELEARFGK